MAAVYFKNWSLYVLWFCLSGFYGTSNIVCYFMPNSHFRYILDIYDLVWLGFLGISTLVGYIMPNLLYPYISNISFGLVGFYGLSTIIGYLMPNSLYTYIHILNTYGLVWFGLVGFHDISTIVDYLMPNSLYTYILNIYMICKHILLITFLNKPELFYAHS